MGGGVTSKTSLIPQYFPHFTHCKAEPAEWLQTVCLASWWLPFSLFLWPLVQKSSAGIICAFVCHKADWPTPKIGFSAVHSSVETLQGTSALSCWMFYYLTLCSHPPRQVLAHITYFCAQSKPGKLPIVTLSPSRFSSCSPFPIWVSVPYPYSLYACIYLYG